MKVNREKFLQQLEAVQPGLAPREIVEQSSCFVFQDGLVTTFNDEITCRHKTDAKITGAVPAAPLLAILRKLPEEELDLSVTDSELVINGKKRTTGIRMEKEITLPVDTVEKPKKWKALADNFSEAVFIVGQCAGTDSSQFASTCIHVSAKWLEACDNYQICRYKIATPMDTPCLVRGTSLKQIVNLGMDEVSETPTWLHFRGPSGLQFSCRRHLDGFPDIAPFLKVTGEPTTLPKGLAEAVDRAEVFSAENADRNYVQVDLRPGKMRLTGTSSLGRYHEIKRLKYDGKPLKFMISPKLLVEITKRHNDCELTADHLKVNGGKFVYVSCLESEEKVNSKEAADDDGPEPAEDE